MGTYLQFMGGNGARDKIRNSAWSMLVGSLRVACLKRLLPIALFLVERFLLPATCMFSLSFSMDIRACWTSHSSSCLHLNILQTAQTAQEREAALAKALKELEEASSSGSMITENVGLKVGEPRSCLCVRVSCPGRNIVRGAGRATWEHLCVVVCVSVWCVWVCCGVCVCVYVCERERTDDPNICQPGTPLSRYR